MDVHTQSYKSTMTAALSTLLIIGAALAVTCHGLECYQCDSDKDDACLQEPSRNISCKAEKFCTKIHYKLPGGCFSFYSS